MNTCPRCFYPTQQDDRKLAVLVEEEPDQYGVLYECGHCGERYVLTEE
jgi:hypothetical protein